MQLSELLTVLANNQKLFITLEDKSGVELITFNAIGYASVEGDLGSRVVLEVKIDSPNAISVKLDDA